jgi:hypothetical protein
MSEYEEPFDEPEDEEAGEPLTLLRDLEEPASDQFSDRLRHRIQRRLLIADTGRLAWAGPLLVVIEILSMLFELIGVAGPDNGKE